MSDETNRGTTGRAQDEVVHPLHYNNHPSGLECIDVNEALPANLACVMRYTWRRDEKGNPLRDLSKALFYAERESAYAAKTPLYQRTLVTTGLYRTPDIIERLAKVSVSEPCPFPKVMSPLAWLASALVDLFQYRIDTQTFFGVLLDALREAVEAEKAKASP